MKNARLIFTAILVLLIPAVVMAADVTTLDPGKSTDWTIWILAGVFGFFLFILSLLPSSTSSEIEMNTILSVMSWIPIGFCAYASFNISRVTSTGFQTLYSNPTIGLLMFIFLACAIINTLRNIALHKVFSNQEKTS
jgi:hypothetical protein